jgi:hypothetical protein
MLIVITVMGAACMFFAPQRQKPRYRKIWVSLMVPGPTPNSKGMVVDRPEIGRIVDGGDCILYEMEHLHTFFDAKGLFIKDTVYYDLFAQAKGRPLGYMATSLGGTFNGPYRADSLLRERFFTFKDVSKRLINTGPGSAERLDGDRLVQRYAVADKKYDSAYYYYDRRLMDIPYSFSPVYDSIHQSKLYKIELLVKKAQRAADVTGKDFKWNMLELGTAPVESEQALDSFFARFRKYMANQ